MFFPTFPHNWKFDGAFDWGTIWSIVSFVAFLLALLSTPSVLMNRRGRPQAALAWVLVLVTIPLLGLFLWWAMGRTHLARKRKKKRRSAAKISQRLNKLQRASTSPMATNWELVSLRRLPPDDAEWGFLPTKGNHVRLLEDADETYPEFERLIAGAREHVHLMFYIWRNDAVGIRFRDLLIEKAKAGVEVRVLLDAFGASKVTGRFMNALREAGGEVRIFGPAVYLQRHLEFNFRNHRKLLIADGQHAVLGGLNIGKEYTAAWHDMALRLQGPVIDQLQEVFVEDWAFAKGKDFVDKRHFDRWGEAQQLVGSPAVCAVVASGPHSSLNLTHEAFFVAINRAEKRVWLTTPYFVPDSPILTSLRTAVFRGVDVRILVPESSDAPLVTLASRSYYPDLLRFGVRIFEYAGTMLHSKTAVLDDDLSFVGSANLDVRSFRLNFELNCFVKSQPVCSELGRVFQQDLKNSREIMAADLEKRGYFVQLAESAAHLMSPLL